jgi:diguanylate cyclase (GGDEF)-like protein
MESDFSMQELLSCVELGKALTSELDSEKLFGKILQKVSELLPAENWSLLLVDETTGELRFEVSVDLPPELVRNVRLRMGEGIAGRAALEQKPMIVANVKQSEFFCDRVDDLSGMTTTSLICVPLVFGGKSVGVLEVVNPRNLEKNPLPVLSIIADYAAIAVENMKQYRHIRELSVRDDLTGLYNTRYLYTALAGMVAKGEPFSLVFMDMDNFKRVVDTHGHLKGSQALQEVAGTIRACLTEPAFGVAYGGDEFVVVLPGLGKDQALHKAEEIRSRMKETLYLTGHGLQAALSASFGVGAYPEDAGNVRDLLALADKAMFRVKEGGKDAIRSA